ncbi:MAG: hypothetical protein HQK60_17495 [Deltaproteobacteria bacterium]|nr:hypothetical protein [Deltaproteobacteria bacterium]
MNKKLAEILKVLTPEEQAEVHSFAAFLLMRRIGFRKSYPISQSLCEDYIEAIAELEGVEWGDESDEEIISQEYGRPIRWI